MRDPVLFRIIHGKHYTVGENIEFGQAMILQSQLRTVLMELHMLIVQKNLN